LHPLSIASGSLKELETLFLICARLKFLAAEDRKSIFAIAEETGKMLAGLIRKLSN